MISDPRPIGAVVSDLLGNLREIVRGEVRLAFAEVRSNLRALRRAAVLMAVAAVLALIGVSYLLLSAVFALALVMPLWAASLALGAAVLTLAAGAAVMGTRSVTRAEGFPHTIAALEETTQWPNRSTS